MFASDRSTNKPNKTLKEWDIDLFRCPATLSSPYGSACSPNKMNNYYLSNTINISTGSKLLVQHYEYKERMISRTQFLQEGLMSDKAYSSVSTSQQKHWLFVTIWAMEQQWLLRLLETGNKILLTERKLNTCYNSWKFQLLTHNMDWIYTNWKAPLYIQTVTISSYFGAPCPRPYLWKTEVDENKDSKISPTLQIDHTKLPKFQLHEITESSQHLPSK
jgi:hypothetical protein